jgi:predicted secreted protein
MKPLTLLCLVLALLDCPIAGAQDRPPPQDILELSASALSEVPADIAVVTLSVVREGSDVSALTQEADGVLNRALIEGRNVPTVTGSSGGFSTQPRTDRQGNATGWTVHGDLIFRSHDFAALGKLAGKLSGPGFAMQVTSSSFEVSQDLRQSEEGELINRAIAAFKVKANVATKALGYASWTIREVKLGAPDGSGPRPMMARALSVGGASLPLEPGRVNLEVEVSGSVQMRH